MNIGSRYVKTIVVIVQLLMGKIGANSVFLWVDGTVHCKKRTNKKFLNVSQRQLKSMQW
jgi:hypothetical protein